MDPYHYVALGSNPKHSSIYVFSIYMVEIDAIAKSMKMNKKEAVNGRVKNQYA